MVVYIIAVTRCQQYIDGLVQDCSNNGVTAALHKAIDIILL